MTTIPVSSTMRSPAADPSSSGTAVDVRRRRRRLTGGLAAALVPAGVLAGSLVQAPTASALPPQSTQTQTFTVADTQQNFVVPSSTYSLTITAVGGSGGSGGGAAGSSGAGGGLGESVTETLAVTPGQSFAVFTGHAGNGPQGGGGFNGVLAGNGANGNSFTNNGGGGGAGTEVGLKGQIIEIAGGGGGGGGGGGVAGYGGGAAGNAGQSGSGGSGPGAGSGGAGTFTGTSPTMGGESASDAGLLTFAGGGGGGGGGWNGATLGGGRAGGSGGAGSGGGGGGAGGASYASMSSATFATAGGGGDGSVTVSWVPGVVATSTVTASGPGYTGQPVTFTDRIVPNVTGAPAASGSVTFQEFNIHTAASTDLATVPVVNGVATWTTSSLPVGTHYITGSYSGDGSYFPEYTGYTTEVVSQGVSTIKLTPNPVAFGNQTVHTQKSQVVTLTDTGNVPFTWNGSVSSNPDVNLSGTSTCFAGTVQPGGTCTFVVLYSPSVLGADNGVLTSSSNFPTSTVINVTGAGVSSGAVKTPTVTGVSPNGGPAAGGTRVTLTGTNFTGVTAIAVGPNKATQVSCSSPTTCTLVTPAGSGVHNITVTNAAGTSIKVGADQFTYDK